MLTREQAEAAALQAAEYPRHDEVAKAELQAVAARKHEREAEDFCAFAAIDQAAFAGRIAASVASATGDLQAAQDAEAAAEDKAAEALRAERAAQDRARDHAEHARQAQEAWKRTQGRGTPAEQTQALIASQAAAQVAQGEQAAAEGKAAARVQADRELAEARSRMAAAEEALQGTRELAVSPGRAFYSPETCAENVTHMLRIWDSLQPVEQQLVRNTIAMYAMLTGLYDEIKAKGGAEREAELDGQRPQYVPPFTLPSAAGVAGR